ncbi:MAG: DUF4861 domain-containing protein [Lacibacter sp.]
MKLKVLFCSVAAALFVLLSDAQTNSKLILTNPLNKARKDELIILSRKQVENKLGKIPFSKFVTLKEAGRPCVVQYDDLNADGKWDELALLQDFKPFESKKLLLSISEKPAAVKAVVRAHARHKRKFADDTFGNDLTVDSIPAGQLGADFNVVKLPPFLTEGPAWENDKVGFRIYFDVRNGKDIWGKTTTQMMMDEVGVNPANNYHEQAAWGMDILKVGQSLGAGSLAMIVPLNGKDTLIRLGGINMGKIVYKKIADGPVRAIIRLSYPEWKLAEGIKPVQLTEEISIWGGQYFYQSRVSVKNAPDQARIVTGIVNLHSKEVKKINGKTVSLIYTYDQQSENKDNLGMGIMLPSSTKNQTGQTTNQGTGVLNTYYVSSPVSKIQPFVFRFYAGWEKSESFFSTESGFKNYLMDQVKLFSTPVLIQ